ncbi:MAG: HAD-IB family phosphatase [Patescibacteria group bacterium]
MKAKFDVICFDVDSTLVTCEGVDWLAKQKGVGEQVKRLTELAMTGKVPMEEVFCQKIDILKPSQKEMQALGEYYCSKLTKGALDVIKDLRKVGVEIFLVTGGFLPAILPLAAKLKIPPARVHANDVYTNKNGHYKGINRECSLTTSNGKAICAKNIAQGRKIAFVGDSVTDLATQPVVTTFIGFGGVVTRKKVKEEADYFIKTESLEPLLWLVV